LIKEQAAVETENKITEQMTSEVVASKVQAPETDKVDEK
jgi:hypothetical protein